MPDSRSARPAHRPSRRQQLIDGAVEMLAIKPVETVTVAEVVDQVGMTPAAFYYHFKSRDELLQEIVDSFAAQWAANAEQWWGEAQTVADVLYVARRLLEWGNEQRPTSTVYFVTSKGGSLAVEESRSRTMATVTGAIVDALCRAQSAEDSAGIRLDAVAVLTVLESAMRSQLAVDPTFRELGPRRFHDEVTRICADIVQRGPSVDTA